MQDLHGDIPRVFCKFEVEDGTREYGFELNREAYSNAVLSPLRYSSIIVDLSAENTEGVSLAVSNSYINKTSNGVQIKYSNRDEKFVEISSTVLNERSQGLQLPITMIWIPLGCQFVGDFFHGGVDNVTHQGKVVKHEFGLFFQRCLWSKRR
jgi:hypothetical protein